jgi:metallo-beta-lactamase family protein
MKAEKISIQFLGAAETVTGSKHLLKTPEVTILVDCGMYQGLKALRLKNREKLPIDEKSIDLLLITHAHLDHCGYIPVLVKNGFKGKILMTPPTRELVEIILMDSAKIQEEDARKANEECYTIHQPATPIYTVKDVEKCLKQFETKLDLKWVKISHNVSFRFLKNGHILGSAFIELDCYGKKIVFSGDIGRYNNDLMGNPTTIEEADYLVMESTYGDRIHPSTSAIDALETAILHTIEKGGNLLIPSFAVERAQEIMFLINRLKEEKRILKNIPVYLDSPMGANATDVFLNHPSWHKLSTADTHLIYRDINIIRDYGDSLKIMKENRSKIVIAASGMLTGGRVLGYLKEYSTEPKNTILLVGYQGEGTRGRSLKEGIREVKLHGKYYQIDCEILTIETMSGHADQQEMLTWLKGFTRKPKQIFLVHGEPQAQNTWRVKIKDEVGIQCIIPTLNEEIELI